MTTEYSVCYKCGDKVLDDYMERGLCPVCVQEAKDRKALTAGQS